MNPPNLLILHAHDMGRYNSLYGHDLPTPHLQAWSKDAVIFRHAHCAAPTCSPSRAAMLTGMVAHRTGVLGLTHRGWDMNDQNKHLATILKKAGFHTAMAGVQHEFDVKGPCPYQEVLSSPDKPGLGRDRQTAEAAAAYLKSNPKGPFFLWAGFFYPHLPHPPADADLPAHRMLAPPCLPDTPQSREDWAGYATALREADKSMGLILNALEESGLAPNTLVLVTTDHGVPFPGMKCRLTQHGTGVTLALKDPRKPMGGKVCDSLVSHLDVLPTLCDLLGVPIPPNLDGVSLKPLLAGETDRARDDLFAEVSYHATYEPMRSVRTARYNYIRRFEPNPKPACANIDRSRAKTLWVEHGYSEYLLDTEELYDTLFDPQENRNLARDPRCQGTLLDMRGKLKWWMEKTQDPLLNGDIPSPGAHFVDPRHGAVDPGSK